MASRPDLHPVSGVGCHEGPEPDRTDLIPLYPADQPIKEPAVPEGSHPESGWADLSSVAVGPDLVYQIALFHARNSAQLAMPVKANWPLDSGPQDGVNQP